MSSFTTSELLLLNLRCFSVINDILQFNKTWAARLIEHQVEISDLIKAGHSHYTDLLRCLMELRVMCIQSRFTLDIIKMELMIAIENESFDNVNIYEITAASRRLKTGFESFNQSFNKIGRDVLSFSNKIEKEKEKLKNEPCSIDYLGLTLNYVSVGLATGCTYHNAKKSKNDRSMEIALCMSAGGLSFTSSVASAVMKEKKKQKLMELEQVLGKLETKVPALLDAVIEFTTKVKDPMEYIGHHIELAEKNILCHNRENPGRVLAQARLMLEKTIALEAMFKEIQDKANIHSDFLRRAVRLEHPRSLIYLH